MSWTLTRVAEHVNGKVVGNTEHRITSVATLSNATSEQISFLANPKYKKYLDSTSAGAVLVAKDSISDLPYINLIEVDDPYVAYAKVATLIHPSPKVTPGIHPTAWIDPTATIADDVSIGSHASIGAGSIIETGVEIGAGCVIEKNVHIGADSCIRSNVTLCNETKVGQRVIIHPGVVIGADGFGIANDKGKWIKVPQLGAVDIGDDVEIGANTTIDRGAIENTTIANGVKLDNQIQIGHNVVIGEHTVIAGCVGIAGSTTIGKYCAIGGGSGFAGHINICDGVQLTGMSMVTKSINEPGVYSSGIPIERTREWHKNVIRYRQLDRLFDRVTKLEKADKN